jgi:hypothetical protein
MPAAEARADARCCVGERRRAAHGGWRRDARCYINVGEAPAWREETVDPGCGNVGEGSDDGRSGKETGWPGGRRPGGM